MTGLEAASESFDELKAQALEAAGRGDLTGAWRCWEEIRAAFPENPEAHVGAADALRKLKRLDEADQLLQEALARFSNNPRIAWEHARVAGERRDWPEAARRWEALRARFPDAPMASLEVAVARREMGQLEDAERLLQESAPRFPDNAQIAWERVRLAGVRRDWAEAERRWRAYRGQFPDQPFVYMTGANTLRELGRLEEAERLLQEGAEQFADNAQIARERARLAAAREDWPEAARLWTAVVERWPDDLQGHLGVLTALAVTGREDEEALAAAQSTLSRARKTESEGEAADRLELAISQARRDWPTMRRLCEKLIARQAEPSTTLLTQLATACWGMRDLEAAERAGAAVVARQPTRPYPMALVAWIATETGDAEKAIAQYRELARIAPDNPRWPLQIAQLLNFLGRVDESTAEMERARARWPEDPQITMWMLNHGLCGPAAEGNGDRQGALGLARVERELRQIVELAPTDGELLRPAISDERDRDVIIGARQGSETAVIVFTGPHDHVTMPIGIFDRYLAALGVSAVYLKDFTRLMYRKGVRSLGDRDATLAALRDLAGRLGARRLCTIGVDTGAAIGYGVRLAADRILGFGIPTTKRLAPVSIEPVRNILRKRLVKEAGGYGGDLGAFLREHPYTARIALFYADGLEVDKAHAEHLAGLAGVSLHPQSTSEHAVLRWMAQREGLREVLAAALGLDE